MDCLPKDRLREMDDRPIVSIALDPEIYGEDAKLLVRYWSATQRSAIEDAVMRRRERNGRASSALFRWDVLKASLVNPDGTPYLEDADREWFMGKNAPMAEQIFERACKMNGLREAEVAELEGNSEADQQS